MIDEALEHLVKGIVDNPEDVNVKEKTHRRGTTLEVRVNPKISVRSLVVTDVQQRLCALS